MTENAASDWRHVTLPDGRKVEYVWTEDDGEVLDIGPGHRRLLVTLTIDGEIVTMPIVVTPEQIAEAFRAE